MRATELSLAAQTAYAELLHATQARELQRSVAQLNGSFAAKRIKGRTYWYFAYRDVGGALRQLYVGPDSPRVCRLIKRFRDEAPVPLAPLARAAGALGCAAAVPRHFRIVRRLAEYGFFRAGGVLVGTHAFLCMGNGLGLRFTEGARTLDVDLAHAGRNISVALPANVQVDVHKALESLEMGFLPITELQGAAGATTLNPKDPESRVDFLTTLGRGGGSRSVRVPNLNVALQPLPFMEFPLQDTIQAALFCDEGAVAVNIPAPGRFAVHKLIVYGERKGALRVKARKDLHQSAALIEPLAASNPEELDQAWRDALSRGPGWVKRALQGRAALAHLEPKVQGLEWLAVPAGRESG
ncbi:MAG: hypothetical protein EXR30_00470 [Betaproteobacteria bacterium]|nr:hypothetical protein [Betaproteobacteria bacterium]MSQ87889.1 hypothetical protein [Betaproteobacteria bacterium]